MANTSWNPGDKSASITLSGTNNLVATGGAGTGGVRAIDNQTTGKFYFEITTTTFASTGSTVAILTAARGLTTAISSGTGAAGAVRSGIVYIEGVAQGFSLGTVASGSVVCFACDLTGKLFWIRKGAAGAWNSAGNPATGAGGVALTSMGAGVGAYPYFFSSSPGEVVTANFGDTTFVGAVPAGFTSGWPGVAAASAAQARAMVLA